MPQLHYVRLSWSTGRVHALTAINTNTPHTTVSIEPHRNTVKGSQESMSLSLDRL